MEINDEISGFCCCVHEVFAFLRCYAANIGSCLLTLQNRLSSALKMEPLIFTLFGCYTVHIGSCSW